MTTTTTTTQHRKHRFPRDLGRFLNLEGGMYGSLDIRAMTPHILELETGDGDFLRFDRRQATELRDSVDRFLALDHPEVPLPAGDVVEVVTESEEVREEVIVRPSRRRRRTR